MPSELNTSVPCEDVGPVKSVATNAFVEVNVPVFISLLNTLPDTVFEPLVEPVIVL